MQWSILALGIVLACRIAGAAELSLDFSQYKTNEPLPGFRSTVVGEGQPGEWRVVLDDMPSLLAPVSPRSPDVRQRLVLAQLSRDRTDEHFPVLLFAKETFSDFTLTTRFKIVAGEVEQIAGIVFRFQDERNFYYVRASAQSGTVYFFKVVEGERMPPIGNKLDVVQGVWYDLTVECRGTQIHVRLNDKDAFPILGDTSFASGKIGFLTKSDAVSHFGDTRIVYQPKEGLAQALVRDAIRKYDRLKGLKIYAANTNEVQARVLASTDPTEVGQPAPPEELDVITRGTIYYGKGKDTAVVSMPLRDVNGEVVAAVRVVLSKLPGQTERSAIVRAQPVVRMMQPRVHRHSDLFQ